MSLPRRSREGAEHKSCHSPAEKRGQQRWQLNFLSNKAAVLMQMCLRNEIPAKRKADNALHKRNYLGPDGFFQGFGVYPWRLFFFFYDFFRSRRRLDWGRGGDGRAGVLSGTKPLWTERRRRMKVGKRCRALIAQPRSPQDPGALGKHPLMRPPRSSRPRFFGGGGSDPAEKGNGIGMCWLLSPLSPSIPAQTAGKTRNF